MAEPTEEQLNAFTDAVSIATWAGITGEPITHEHGVCLDTQCYDTTTLLQWLEKNPTLPHNRAPMPLMELRWLMARPEPWPAATANGQVSVANST